MLLSLLSLAKFIQSNTLRVRKNVRNRVFHITSGCLLGALSISSAFAIPHTPQPPQIEASSYILIDANSGRVLAEKNSDQPLEPASLTKIMTVYAVDAELNKKTLSLDDLVTISETAWRTEGSRMFVDPKTQVTIGDLLKGVIIQSGNDASVALAEHLAGSEAAFSELMNYYARNLGMNNTYFVNSTGLPDPNHMTTARDLAILSQALIRDFPESYSQHAEKEFTYNSIKQHNRNNLLWRDNSVDGIKTGHTSSAGYCLVASAQRDGMRVISVVMGSANEEARASQTQALINYGFRFYETHKLYTAYQTIQSPTVFKGQHHSVNLGVAEDLYITIPRGRYDELAIESELPQHLEAPLQQGESYGTVKIRLDEEIVSEQNLIALNDVPEGGVWRRTVDAVRLLWQDSESKA